MTGVLSVFSCLFFAVLDILSSVWTTILITTCHSLCESLLSVLIAKKLTLQGRKVGAREREKFTHSPLVLPVLSFCGDFQRESCWGINSFSVISSLLLKASGTFRGARDRSRMLPDEALKDDYVIRVYRCLTRPKIDINEGFPFM